VSDRPLRPFCLPALAALCLLLGASPWGPLRVGVFDGQGGAASCVVDAFESLRLDPGIRPSLVTPSDLQRGALDRLDVLVFPGGSGSRQTHDLGDSGAGRVRRFVLDEGKGAVGLCAGAYLLSDTPGYACLHLAPVQAIDREHDERGHGLIRFAATDAGLALFPELKGVASPTVYYYEGPILEPAAAPAPFEALATMGSDVHLENGAPAGMTPGRPLFVSAEAGKGRVFLSVGHPESTPGLRWMVPRAVRWVARRPPVPYAAPSVRPGLIPDPILFDDALRAEEAALFQKLLYAPPDERVAAVARLAAIRSWAGPRWIRGCLRDADPRVRCAAAAALADLEATWALPDLEAAARAEANASALDAFGQASARLQALAAR